MLKTVLLVGCGNMGRALLVRWREKFAVTAIDPAGGEAILPNPSQMPQNYEPEAVVLAVKPQSMEAVLPEYLNRFGTKPVYISIAAGKTLSWFEERLGKDARVIRAMPNTPAQIGQGMTVLAAGRKATTGDRAGAEALFALSGQTLWLEDEGLMHAATGLSGSGPAYVFLFLEALAAAGEKQGLPPLAARRLALQTVVGAAGLAAAGETPFGELRARVTSPGGTTEAALKTLAPLPDLVQQAVEAAVKRSKELG